MKLATQFMNEILRSLSSKWILCFLLLKRTNKLSAIWERNSTNKVIAEMENRGARNLYCCNKQIIVKLRWFSHRQVKSLLPSHWFCWEEYFKLKRSDSFGIYQNFYDENKSWRVFASTLENSKLSNNGDRFQTLIFAHIQTRFHRISRGNLIDELDATNSLRAT